MQPRKISGFIESLKFIPPFNFKPGVLELRLMLLLLSLMLIVAPVMAAEQLTKDDFAEPVIEGINKTFYLIGEEVSGTYLIQPKTDDKATRLDNRNYEIYNYLDSPKLRAEIAYKQGGVIVKEGEDYINARLNEWDYGLNSLKIEFSGKIPPVENRVEDFVILRINVTDADADVLKPVVVKVVNENAFSQAISALESKVEELNSKSQELVNLGVAVGVAKQKIKTAQDYITDGKNYYAQKKYIEADASLSKAEEYLNEAENELIRLDVNYRFAQAEDKLDEFLEKISELDAAALQAKEKGISTTAYDIKLQQFKTKYNTLYNRLEVNAKDYIDNGLYDDAKTTIESVINDANKAISEIDSLISEIKAQVPEETPAPTPTATPTPTPSEPFYSGIVKYFEENRDTILLYSGLLVGIVVLGFAAYKGTKAYMKRRKWDELK